jgi:hypothetical protein
MDSCCLRMYFAAWEWSGLSLRLGTSHSQSLQGAAVTDFLNDC